ncbi:MAG: hypothetical protein J6R38_05440 [Alistipes sp.]|nr:hypothetical protein [Alistipes sp.]
MKKFFSMMVAVAAMFAFASCDKEPAPAPTPEGGKLATPVLSVVDVTETGFTVVWDAIENAAAYSVVFNRDIQTVTENRVVFTNLNQGSYVVRVKAVGAEGSNWEDSGYGEVTGEVTGLTNVDWFTQELYTAISEEDGLYPSNSLFFTWKGTGVKSVEFGLFETASVEGVDLSQIRPNLQDFGADTDAVLDEINSEKGATYVFEELTGMTSYTMFTIVTNEVGLEYVAVSECKTEAAETSEAAQKWLGAWELTSHETITYAEEGIVFGEKEETFKVNISGDVSDPNAVLVEGFSALEGSVAYGLVDTETGDLMLMSGLTIGYDEQYQAYYMWLTYFMIGDTGQGQFFSDFMPAYIFSMDKDGKVSCEMFVAEAKYQDGTAVEITATHFDIFGVTEAGQLYFFQDEYRCGAMDMVKSEAAPTAKRFVKGAKRQIATPVVKSMGELTSVVYLQ